MSDKKVEKISLQNIYNKPQLEKKQNKEDFSLLFDAENMQEQEKLEGLSIEKRKTTAEEENLAAQKQASLEKASRMTPQEARRRAVAQEAYAKKQNEFLNIPKEQQEAIKEQTTASLEYLLENGKILLAEQDKADGPIARKGNKVREFFGGKKTKKNVEAQFAGQEKFIEELKEAGSPEEFARIYKENTGVEYDPDKIDKYLEAKNYSQMANAGLAKCSEFQKALSNEKITGGELISATQKFYGCSQEEAVKKLNDYAESNGKKYKFDNDGNLSVTATVYSLKGTTEVTKTYKPDEVGSEIQSHKEGDIISQAYSGFRNYAIKCTNEYNDNFEKATGKSIKQVSQDYSKYAKEALGTSGFNGELVQAYCEAQEQVANRVATGVGITGMTLAVGAAPFTGGASLSATPAIAGFAASLGGAMAMSSPFVGNMLNAVDATFSENGMSQEEFNTLMKKNATDAAIIASNIVIGGVSDKIGMVVASKTGSQVLSIASEVSSDAAMSLAADKIITGDFDVSTEAIPQMISAVTSLSTGKYISKSAKTTTKTTTKTSFDIAEKAKKNLISDLKNSDNPKLKALGKQCSKEGINADNYSKLQKAIMKEVHPDKGGSAELAAKYNTYFDDIKPTFDKSVSVSKNSTSNSQSSQATTETPSTPARLEAPKENPFNNTAAETASETAVKPPRQRSIVIKAKNIAKKTPVGQKISNAKEKALSIISENKNIVTENGNDNVLSTIVAKKDVLKENISEQSKEIIEKGALAIDHYHEVKSKVNNIKTNLKALYDDIKADMDNNTQIVSEKSVEKTLKQTDLDIVEISDYIKKMKSELEEIKNLKQEIAEVLNKNEIDISEIKNTEIYEKLGTLPNELENYYNKMQKDINVLNNAYQKIFGDAENGSDIQQNILINFKTEEELLEIKNSFESLDKNHIPLKESLQRAGLDDTAEIIVARNKSVIKQESAESSEAELGLSLACYLLADNNASMAVELTEHLVKEGILHSDSLTTQQQIELIERTNIALPKFIQTLSGDVTLSDDVRTFFKKFTSDCTVTRTSLDVSFKTLDITDDYEILEPEMGKHYVSAITKANEKFGKDNWEITGLISNDKIKEGYFITDKTTDKSTVMLLSENYTKAQEFVDDLYGQNKYEIKHVLGAGTIGESYLVKDLSTGDTRVMKMLKEGVSEAKFEEDKAMITKYIEEYARPEDKEYQLKMIDNMFDAWKEEINYANEADAAIEMAKGAKNFKVAQTVDRGYLKNPDGTVSPNAVSIVMEVAPGYSLDKIEEVLAYKKDAWKAMHPDAVSVNWDEVQDISLIGTSYQKYAGTWVDKTESYREKLALTYQKALNEQTMYMSKSGEKTIHGDPHSGNVFFDMTEKGDLELTFIDTGNVVRTTNSQTLSDIKSTANILLGNTKSISKDLLNGAKGVKPDTVDKFAAYLDENLFSESKGSLSNVATDITAVLNDFMQQEQIIPNVDNVNKLKAMLTRLNTSREIFALTDTKSNKAKDIMAMAKGISQAMVKDPKGTIQTIKPLIEYAKEHSDEALLTFFRSILKESDLKL